MTPCSFVNIISIPDEHSASIIRGEDGGITALQMLISTYQMTCCHNPEDDNGDHQEHDNVESEFVNDLMKLLTRPGWNLNVQLKRS
jgi:hypothetical protein